MQFFIRPPDGEIVEIIFIFVFSSDGDIVNYKFNMLVVEHDS